jgi:hypothetical protein
MPICMQILSLFSRLKDSSAPDFAKLDKSPSSVFWKTKTGQTWSSFDSSQQIDNSLPHGLYRYRVTLQAFEAFKSKANDHIDERLTDIRLTTFCAMLGVVKISKRFLPTYRKLVNVQALSYTQYGNEIMIGRRGRLGNDRRRRQIDCLRRTARRGACHLVRRKCLDESRNRFNSSGLPI